MNQCDNKKEQSSFRTIENIIYFTNIFIHNFKETFVVKNKGDLLLRPILIEFL